MKDHFPEMPSKRCSRCGRMKKIMHFARSAQAKDGYVGTCRHCVLQGDRERRERNAVPADLPFNPDRSFEKKVEKPLARIYERRYYSRARPRNFSCGNAARPSRQGLTRDSR